MLFRRRYRYHFSLKIGPPLIDEPDYMRQGGKFAQPDLVIARDSVRLADCGKHFRLLDCVDAQVGLEIQVEIQHETVGRLMRLPRNVPYAGTATCFSTRLYSTSHT